MKNDVLETIKIKANFIEQKTITKDNNNFTFIKFANPQIGVFQLFFKSELSCNYFDEFMIFLKPNVFNEKIQLSVESITKVK